MKLLDQWGVDEMKYKINNLEVKNDEEYQELLEINETLKHIKSNLNDVDELIGSGVVE